MKSIQNSNKIRLDKWLWAVRLYKTRSLSQEMINGGKVHYNGQRCKPSKEVEIGAKITLRIGHDEREIEVIELGHKRVSAPIAQEMYRESEQSLAKREAAAAARKTMNAGMSHSDSRPDKKQRRQIIRFKNQDNL
ncbi:ribosome-associated heat shock protein Hsp15 [Paraferrimonas sp. SM1919]|uniref:ribosome-associated heat shock protein Hsp15 n=1 Tax=Paraferrimonas sp. SM1919 TaxID=2662263 RepID=UPI0013D851F6|nr:ribosome-associated heat shock protein Hsp15 [Paraferrimonas sp. SM1919]